MVGLRNQHQGKLRAMPYMGALNGVASGQRGSGGEGSHPINSLKYEHGLGRKVAIEHVYIYTAPSPDNQVHCPHIKPPRLQAPIEHWWPDMNPTKVAVGIAAKVKLCRLRV